jgi:serine/threonine protein kinase
MLGVRKKSLENPVPKGSISNHLEDILASPFIKEEELPDLEKFIRNFPGLTEHYIPIQIIGEGTFSTVYKAIDVRHYETDKTAWIEWSKQDRHDAMKLFAHIHKLQQRSDGHRKSPIPQQVFDPSTYLNRALLRYMASHIELMKERKDPMVVSYQNITTIKTSIKKEESEENPKAAGSSVLPHFVALKRINPTSSPDRLIDEIQFIAKYGGSSNVIPLITGLRHEDQVIAVFPYFSCPDFRVS